MTPMVIGWVMIPWPKFSCAVYVSYSTTVTWFVSPNVYTPEPVEGPRDSRLTSSFANNVVVDPVSTVACASGPPFTETPIWGRVPAIVSSTEASPPYWPVAPCWPHNMPPGPPWPPAPKTPPWPPVPPLPTSNPPWPPTPPAAISPPSPPGPPLPNNSALPPAPPGAVGPPIPPIPPLPHSNPPVPPVPPGAPQPPMPPVPPVPSNPAGPPAPPRDPAAMLSPPPPPLPHKIPPAPPDVPTPSASVVPLLPLPISGRPNSVLVGALIAPSTSCSRVCSGAALAA